MIDGDWYQAVHVNDAINFTNEENQWNEHKVEFRHHVKRRDEIRGEDFTKIFPELKEMLDD